jgi:hypothetical protein
VDRSDPSQTAELSWRFLKRMRTTTKSLNQDSRCPGLDSNSHLQDARQKRHCLSQLSRSRVENDCNISTRCHIPEYNEEGERHLSASVWCPVTARLLPWLYGDTVLPTQALHRQNATARHSKLSLYHMVCPFGMPHIPSELSPTKPV